MHTKTISSERARAVHRLACAGAPYAALAVAAGHDLTVVRAAAAFVSGDPSDYRIMSRQTVVFRLEGLERCLAAGALGVASALSAAA